MNSLLRDSIITYRLSFVYCVAQENVVLETQGMIPDTAGRLSTAVEDLQLLVDESEGDEISTDEYKAAVEALKYAASVLKESG